MIRVLTPLCSSRNASGVRRERKLGTVLRCGVLAALWVLLANGVARAEPYFAVREGLPCGACHVNVTGGGMRTDLVRTHAREILRYPNFFGAFSNPPDYFTGEINKYVALGGDLRVSESAIFQDEPVNGEVPNNKVFRSRLESNEIEVTEAVLYGEVRLIPDYLILYIDQRLQPQTDNREAWAMLYGFLPWDAFIKGGRMFLPYGLQLQDDGAFIRAGTNGSANTGFSFNNQQAGLEMGVRPQPFTIIAAVTDGASGDNDVQVTATAYALPTDLPVVRSVLLGGSASYVSPPGSQQIAWALFAGTNYERLTVLGEVDFLQTKNPTTGGRTVGQFISYVEADYLFFDWLNFKVAVDYADDDGNLAEHTDDAENRVSFGLEPFWNRFLQTRLFYRIGNGVRSQPSHNQNVLLFEIHAFF